MKKKMRLTVKKLCVLMLSLLFIASCSPTIGSEAWCKDLKEKPKGDWTATEAKDFAKHCIF